MTSGELRRKFLEFFKSRGHAIVPSSSLIPDDPSVLLTTAGMQQFKPYFLGKADPTRNFGSKRTASIQKAFRTSDIDEAGDESHLTFFEMLGHFSFGDYFKKETIEWTYELLTDVFGVEKERISATVFIGDDKIPFDEESYNAWSKLIPENNIRKGGREDNVWGPAGPEGPCGAANEVYVDSLEVATLVFMEFNALSDGKLTLLPQKGVDVGWGFERVAMILQKKKNIFETDLFQPLFELLPNSLDLRQKRIVTDHLRASVFLLADGVRPSNKEAGYILRRLLRRAITFEQLNKLSPETYEKILLAVISGYGNFYSELALEKNSIINEYWQERERFLKTLERGMKKIDELPEIGAEAAFDLYQTFGIPFETIKDVAGQRAEKLARHDFDEELKKHQEISRAGLEKKFGGHGLILNTGEIKAANAEEVKIVTRLHTATHLLQAALRKVLGPGVKQMGSDITARRTRFDFSFPRKLTPEEVTAVEKMINDVISQDYSVIMEEMAYSDAIKSNALFFFREKYPERVSVYSVVDDRGGLFSKEFCGGPHVSKTAEIGKFKIIKEEAVGAGVRRIRGVVVE